MSLRSIALTACVVLIVWWWQRSRRVKDIALVRAKSYCESLSLRLLDDALVLKRLRPTRLRSGSWVCERRFAFDFSTAGGQRYAGEVRMLGLQVERIQLQPHRID